MEHLRRRGQELEAKVLSEGLRLLLAGTLDVHWGRAEIREGGGGSAGARGGRMP